MKKFIFLLLFVFGFSFIAVSQVKPSKLNRSAYVKPSIKSEQKLFLKIEGVDGDSADKDHLNWIELQSFYFDTNIEVNGSEKSFLMSISKLPNISSVEIAFYTTSKKVFSNVKLEVTQVIKGKLVTIFEYKFDDVSFDFYSIEKSNSKMTIENIKLLAGSVDMTHYLYDKYGNFSKKVERTLESN